MFVKPVRFQLALMFAIMLGFAVLMYSTLTIETLKNFRYSQTSAPPRHTNLPRMLRSVYPLTRASATADDNRRHDYHRPSTLAVYVRDVDDTPESRELTFFLTGVSMALYQRNFSAVGCLVGHTVFAADFFADDFLRCRVKAASLLSGVRLAPVLVLDDVLKTALKGPVQLRLELVTSLQPGDVNHLPETTDLETDLAVRYQLRQLMSVRSEHVFSNQYDAITPSGSIHTARYETCLVTQIKPSTHLLPDWIDYHRRVGIDHIYIFDNDAEEDLSRTYAYRNDVEIIFWPFGRSQLQAFTYAMIALRARCEWNLMINSDEYVMLGLGDGDAFIHDELPPLKRYLTTKRSYTEIFFQWVLMKNSGYITRPKAPVPQAYTHRIVSNERRLRKTMARTDWDWTGSTPHFRRSTAPYSKFFDKNYNMFPERIGDTGMLVHYMLRSWEEFQEKVRSGRANIMNQRTISSIEERRAQGDDERRDEYMKVNSSRQEVYTHFRDIWARVMDGLPNSRSVVAWTDDRSVRCRAVYDVGEHGSGSVALRSKGCSSDQPFP